MLKLITAQVCCRALLFCVVLTVSACSGGDQQGTAESANGANLETIRIVPWGPRFIDFIDFYVGEENGYFADAGIRIEQLAAEGAGDAVRYLVAGNADIAMADPFSGFFAIQRGADLVGLYCPYTRSWMKMVVNSANGINTPADLKGKTIAVTSQASTSRYYAMFLLASAGLTEDDVTMASVGRDFASVLLGGTVDAASTWDSINWGMFRKVGKPEDQGYQIWEYPEVPGPNDVYFAQRKWLEENKDLLQRFINALQKSKRWIAEHPAEAAKLGARYAVGSDDLIRNRVIIDMRIEMQSSGPGVAENGMGWCDVDTMSRIANKSVELGILDQKIDIATVITNEFVESQY